MDHEQREHLPLLNCPDTSLIIIAQKLPPADLVSLCDSHPRFSYLRTYLPEYLDLPGEKINRRTSIMSCWSNTIRCCTRQIPTMDRWQRRSPWRKPGNQISISSCGRSHRLRAGLANRSQGTRRWVRLQMPTCLCNQETQSRNMAASWSKQNQI